MSEELKVSEFSVISPEQIEAFISAVTTLRPLLNERFVMVQEVEELYPELDFGEDLPELIDDEPEDDDAPEIIGHLTLNKFGGLEEFSDVALVTGEPSRLTCERDEAAFGVDESHVIVTIEKTTDQNINDEELVIESNYFRVKEISTVDSDDYHFWIERLYDCDPDTKDIAYQEFLYRRPKTFGSEWVMLAPPSWFGVLARIENELPESEKIQDDSTEDPNRFDQNRFATVMNLLGKVEESNRLDAVPELGQYQFKVVQE